jgi:hypothetical protein
MPSAWAAIVIRSWLRVASAVLKAVPSAPDETVGGDARIVENDGPVRDPLMHANSYPEKLIDQMKELGICRLAIQQP